MHGSFRARENCGGTPDGDHSRYSIARFPSWQRQGYAGAHDRHNNHSERPRAKRGNGRRDNALGPVLVSGNRLARHFGVVRSHVETLAQQGVIERRADGLFDQDQSRLTYFAHLRAEHKRSPRTAADTEHTSAKTEMLRLRLAEKKRQLVHIDEVNEMIDAFAGIVLTAVGGWPARIGGTDLSLRRRADALVYELRTEIAKECRRRADEYERAAQ